MNTGNDELLNHSHAKDGVCSSLSDLFPVGFRWKERWERDGTG